MISPNKKAILKNLLSLCFISILVIGCGSGTQNATLSPPSPTQGTTGTASFILPTTETSITTPTITSVPTLPPSEAEARIMSLLHDNGGCRFPCFLGFVPGQTDIEEFSTFLMETSGSTNLTLKRDGLFYETHIVFDVNSNSVPEKLRSLEISMTAYSKLENRNQKTYMAKYYSDYFQYYMLADILSNYGAPDQAYVFLDTGIADMGLGIDLYLLHLDYTREGWVALFEMPLQRQGDVYIGCPNQAFTSLRVWSPGDSKPARYYGFEDGPEPVLFTIEEATTMTLEEFYEEFKDSTNTACLKTPVNIHK